MIQMMVSSFGNRDLYKHVCRLHRHPPSRRKTDGLQNSNTFGAVKDSLSAQGVGQIARGNKLPVMYFNFFVKDKPSHEYLQSFTQTEVCS